MANTHTLHKGNAEHNKTTDNNRTRKEQQKMRATTGKSNTGSFETGKHPNIERLAAFINKDPYLRDAFIFLTTSGEPLKNERAQVK